MPDYNNGKIYMLESKEGNVIYYGSTTQTLEERLRKHKYNKKIYEEGKYHYITSFKILEIR
jgi:predicted GIY-YIG superfamily endonuclease